MATQQIFMVDALAGAGKTHAATDYAMQAAALGRKTAIIQPSKHLITESYNRAQARNTQAVQITRLDSDSNPGEVAGSLIDHLRTSPEGQGEVLFITHAAFLQVPYWHNRAAWDVIVDEIPNVVEDISIRVPESHRVVTDHLEMQDYNPAYDQVSIKPSSIQVMRRLSENARRDAVWQVFEPLTRRLFNDDWRVFAHTSNFQRLLRGDREQNTLPLFGLLYPSVLADFRTATVMGAMFRESVLYLLWTQLGAEFTPHRIQRQLRYNSHSRGDLLTVEYLWDRPWSKAFRDQHTRDGKQIFDLAVEQAQRAMGSEPFIWIANKDAERDLMPRFTQGIRVSSACHGLNEYQHINNVVYLSALNPQPGQFTFLETLGVNGDELRRSNYLQSLYQAVMRSSLRDPNNTDTKHVLVMDRDAADYLASYFPGCRRLQNGSVPVSDSTGRPGRPKVWKDDAARQRAGREKTRLLAELVELGTQADARTISIIPSIYSREVISHEVSSNQALMQELRQALETEISDKRDNILISPARFNTERSTATRRGLDNIESVYGIWLDNDGGDLTYEGFREIFPKLWMAAFSTYSGGNRYRVFIPTTQPMSVDADHKIKQMITMELARHGYNAKGDRGKQCHGFDVSKITPSSLFYIPCRQPGSQDAFFVEYEGRELDPIDWLSRPTIAGLFDPLPEPEIITTPTAITAPTSKLAAIRLKLSGATREDHDAIKARLTATYLAVPKGTGQSNDAFYKLGKNMMLAGIALPEIQTHLMLTADDRDRKRQVKSIMNSLRRRAQ